MEEVVQGLSLKPGDTVLDGTVGSGGHAEAALKAIGPEGFLIGIDRDGKALEMAARRLQPYGGQVRLIHGNFGELAKLLDEVGIPRVDAVLFDLGVSSLQLEDPERGFSFLKEGPLDMRMDQRQRLTAAHIVNRASYPELRKLLITFGQERWAGRIARAMVRHRPLSLTTELAQIIQKAIPPSGRFGRIHPATRTFQALRIAVNEELELLPRGLAQAFERLKPQGCMAVLAYHSLEDRIVKDFFRKERENGRCVILNQKPIRPSEEELKRNPRARSARLRMAKRL